MSCAVFDTEGDDLEPNATRMWCVSIQDMDATEESIESFDVKQDNLQEGLDRLNEFDEIMGHFIIGHDLPMLKRLYNWEPRDGVKLIDTLVLSRLSNPDRKRPYRYEGKSGPHSLDCWGYRVCRAKPSHEDWSTFSPAMLRRNREDVGINRLTKHLLDSEMDGHDWSESIELENNVLRIMTQQERNGVYFDVDRANELVDELTAKVKYIDDDLTPNLPIRYVARGVPVRKPFKTNGSYSKMSTDWYGEDIVTSPNLVGGPFTRLDILKLDINSIKQIKDYFLDNGWIPTEYNFSKKTGQPTSPKLTEDSYGTITGGMGPQIKERLTLCHRRNQIQGWLDRLRPDSRLTAGANTLGTPTGRMRHNNVVNVPKAADYVPYGIQMRSLFCVPKGYKLVGCDAEQLELRLLAHYMGDQNYIQEILHGDIHTYNQTLAGLSTRDAAKTFIYAFIYGAGDEKLGAIVEGTGQEGTRLRKTFLDGLPELKRLITRVKRASNKGWLKGLDGRKLWLRRGDNGEIQKHKALNLYIQGAGAVIMKKAMVILDELILQDRLDAKKVLDMHDEFQFEVLERDAERVAELCERAIVLSGESFNLKIPMAGQSKIGNNWAETH